MASYNFQSIDVPLAAGTYTYIGVTGVDAAGDAVGYYGYSDGDGDSYFHGFVVGNHNSVATTFDPPGSSNTNGVFITPDGVIYGDYVDYANRQDGFIDRNGNVAQYNFVTNEYTVISGLDDAGDMFGNFYAGYGPVRSFVDIDNVFSIVDVGGTGATSVSGINASGEIVGTYSDASFNNHGFIIKNGVTTTVDGAGAYTTSVIGVSDAGLVVGNYTDPSGHDHAFIDNDGVITTFDIAGSIGTQIEAISESGEFVGNYVDSSGHIHGFTDIQGAVATVDVPGSTETNILGVNASGTIFGYYNDTNGQHGFVGADADIAADDNTFDSASLVTTTFGSSADAGGWSSDAVFHRTLADVNGDGRADIVGFGYNSTLVSLANTAGGFDAPITGVNSFGYSAAGGGWSTETQYPRTAADVNGDGMADLVGFGYGGTFVALATGGGQFADPMLATTAFGSSTAAGGWSEDNTYHRDVADVNGDGLADLVGFGYDGTYVSLATGGGNFAAPVLSSTTFGSSAAAGGWSDDNIYHRELADVNGDGMADIVGFGSDSTYVALATGGGHFADPIAALNGFGSSVAGGNWSDQTTYTRHLADINGDGRADIVGFGYSGTVIAYGNADGTFQPAQTDIAAFGANSAAGGWSSNDLYPRLLGDIDGGGAADIVGFGNSGVYVAHSNVNWVG